MKVSIFESQLSQFDAQLALLSAALIRNDSNELVAAAGELQSMTVVFSKVLRQASADFKENPQAQLHVKKIAAALASMREGLLRRSVAVDRALSALVPATQQVDTYAPKMGAFASQPYGSAGRPSGEFKVLAA